MDETNNNITLEKILYSFNDFSNAIQKSLNYIREDISNLKQEVKELKEDVSVLKQEVKELKEDVRVLKQEVKDLKVEMKELRQEFETEKGKNEKCWLENKKKWEIYERNRKQDKKEILEILFNYDMAISEKIGDANARKMLKSI